ncbi:hypothetical protein, partial [Staphylococcus simulans]
AITMQFLMVVLSFPCRKTKKIAFAFLLNGERQKTKIIRLQSRRIKPKERFVMMSYEVNNSNNNLICHDYHLELGGNVSLDETTEISLKDNENKLKYFIMQEFYKLNIPAMNINIFRIAVVYDKTKKNKPIKYIHVPISIKNYFDVNLRIDVEQNHDSLLTLNTIFEANLLNVIQSIKNKHNDIKNEVNQKIMSEYQDLFIDYNFEIMS